MSFGIANNVKSRVVRECTPELFHRVLDSQVVAEVCAQIKDALEAVRRGEMSPEDFETLKGNLKKALIIFTFHATFKNGRRKNEEAIPSGLSIYDLDHIPNPEGRWREIEPRKEELGIVLAHITPSSEGLRLVFVIPQGMTLADAQAWMARQLGDDKYDACVKDYARCSFAVPREYVLFLDADALFSPQIPQISTDKFLLADGVLNENKENNLCQSVESVVDSYPPTYEDIPYETIVEVLEEQMGGEPEHGSRNTFIFSMACHLRHVCNDDASWIAQILPTYGENKDKWMASIRSACNRNQTKFMPRIMQRTLAICRDRLEAESQETGAGEPPKMPNRLPPLIKLLVSKTPKIYQPAVAHAVFPALATHLWRTTFRYIDNVEHEATLMNVLMAGTGAGKNCISEPINHILKDIRQRDSENLQREKEWKAEMQTKGSNKDKRKRPEGLVIQEIDPDMTNAAFVQRLADAEERFLYTKMNEIDQFDALKTSARSKAHFQIMCLAFDPGNVYGQTRVGTGSVSERVCIRFNWNASTTVHKGQTYFRSVLTDGPVSRINFCTIPEQPIGSDMPVYGTYDAGFDEELRPYIERLNKARGLVECQGARNLAKKLKEENADFARLSQSRVYENLSFRANVIAYLKAMVLYVAHGGVWDKVTEDFIRWSLKYDMWCKMKFFGEAIEEMENVGLRDKRRGPQNLLDLLPDIFTREEAGQMRVRQGVVSGTVGNMLATWKKRKYIEPYGEVMPDDQQGRQQYIKTAIYLKKR